MAEVTDGSAKKKLQHSFSVLLFLQILISSQVRQEFYSLLVLKCARSKYKLPFPYLVCNKHIEVCISAL